jgi:hypothetical protein
LAVLILSIVVGLFAPPLARKKVSAKLINYTLLTSAFFAVFALTSWALGSLDWCAIFATVCESIFMLCVWLAQPGGASDNRRPGGGGGGGDDDGPPLLPHDWDEFDRLRARWGSRAHAHARTRVRPRERVRA